MMRFLTNRWVHFILLFSFLLFAVFNSASPARWHKEMQYYAFDTLNALFPREASGEVYIVDIDDDSLQSIGQWPWPRTVIAELVENLTDLGAKVIAFDGVLAEPDRSSPRFVAQNLPKNDDFKGVKEKINSLPDHDEVLAEAIKNTGIFVSAFTHGSYSQTPRKPRLTKPILVRKNDSKVFLDNAFQFNKAAVFLPELEKAAAGNGSFMASPDHDGIIRKTAMIFSDGQLLYPSLAVEAVRVSQDRRLISKIKNNAHFSKTLIDSNYAIEVGEYDIPIESDAVFYLYFRKFDEAGSDYISAHKVINPAFHGEIRARVKDKVILIGASAEGLKDLRSTALEAFEPGVEIHANAIEQILQGIYLLRPDIVVGVEAVFILVSGLLMIMLAPFINVIILGGVCFLLIGGAALGAAWSYVEYQILFDPIYLGVVSLSIFILSTLLTYIRVEHERKQVRSAFGMYVAPDVMRDLEKNPDKLKLGGENKDLTIMFTDIRRFTTISEGLSPEELIHLMNDFLTAMSDIVLEHGGTIDKYMGDAMMVFWNAPKDIENHEREACVAALKMQAALAPINENIRLQAENENKEPVLLQAGIGVNTGPCAVGNMGSKQRFAYSTLGDAVNLASRLEGQTKTYGVETLIGEDTAKQVDDMAVLEVDLLQVKGKTKPVRVFALLGDAEMAQTIEFKDFKKRHDEMINNYQAKSFDLAMTCLKGCRKIDGYDLGAMHDLYEERIEALIDNPPGGDWSGIYEATTK